MINELDISLTEKCNLACDYCCVYKDENKTLTLKQLKRAIEILFLFDTKHKEKIIAISGGEPLLFFDKVKKIFKYGKSIGNERGYRTDFSIVTNGILLDEKKLKWFKKAGFKVGVSIDGRFVGNKHRKTKDGKCVYQILKDKLPLFLKYKDIIQIKMTISPDVAKYSREEFLFFVRKGFKDISLQAMLGVRWPRKEASFYLKTYETYLKWKKKTVSKNYLKSLDFSFVCPKTKDKIFIDVLGNVLLCDLFEFFSHKDREKYSCGNIFDKDIKEKIINCKKKFPILICEFVRDLNWNKICKNCELTRACSEMFCWAFDLKKRKFDFSYIPDNLWLTKNLDKLRLRYRIK